MWIIRGIQSFSNIQMRLCISHPHYGLSDRQCDCIFLHFCFASLIYVHRFKKETKRARKKLSKVFVVSPGLTIPRFTPLFFSLFFSLANFRNHGKFWKFNYWEVMQSRNRNLKVKLLQTSDELLKDRIRIRQLCLRGGMRSLPTFLSRIKMEIYSREARGDTLVFSFEIPEKWVLFQLTNYSMVFTSLFSPCGTLGNPKRRLDPFWVYTLFSELFVSFFFFSRRCFYSSLMTFTHPSCMLFRSYKYRSFFGYTIIIVVNSMRLLSFPVVSIIFPKFDPVHRLML